MMDYGGVIPFTPRTTDAERTAFCFLSLVKRFSHAQFLSFLPLREIVQPQVHYKEAKTDKSGKWLIFDNVGSIYYVCPWEAMHRFTLVYQSIDW